MQLVDFEKATTMEMVKSRNNLRKLLLLHKTLMKAKETCNQIEQNINQIELQLKNRKSLSAS